MVNKMIKLIIGYAMLSFKFAICLPLIICAILLECLKNVEKRHGIYNEDAEDGW